MKKIFFTDDVMIDALFESSWSRIVGWMDKHDIAIITAFRSELKDIHDVKKTDIPDGMKIGDKFSLQLNRQRNAKLKSELMARGYGVTKIDGNYIEGVGGKDLKEVTEESFFVVNLNDDSDFRSEIFILSERYNQDSFLYKPMGDDHAYVVGTNDNAYPGYGEDDDLGTLTSLPSKFMSRIKLACLAFVNKNAWIVKNKREDLKKAEMDDFEHSYSWKEDIERPTFSYRKRARIEKEAAKRWESAKQMDESVYYNLRSKKKNNGLNDDEKKTYKKMISDKMLISVYPNKESYIKHVSEEYARKNSIDMSIEDKIILERAYEWEKLMRNNGIELETISDIKGFSRQCIRKFLK